MLHVDHSRHAQSPGSSLPGTRVAAHGKRAAPLLARFLLTAQGAGASGLFSQPRVRHGAQMLQIYCGALQRHFILLTVYLICVCHLLILCSYSVCLFVFVRLVVLMINSFCFANRPAVVHWLLTMK